MLEEVLKRLEEGGNASEKEVHLPHARSGVLGHMICQEGMSPTESKVCAVSDAPDPESGRIEIVPGVSELLWKVPVQPSHHYSTLYSLLKKNAHRTWGKSQKAAFKGVKGLLQSFDLLVHFDPEELLILAYDALHHELGTVLSHCMQNGSERLIAFALYPSGEEILAS